MRASVEEVIPHERASNAENPGAAQESAWIAASQGGDAAAFNRLVLRWEKPIYNLSLRMLAEESRSRVRRALEHLTPEQRAVVELKFFQELTFEEISSVIRVPLSTIKSRLYSGLDLLKAMLSRPEREGSRADVWRQG